MSDAPEGTVPPSERIVVDDEAKALLGATLYAGRNPTQTELWSAEAVAADRGRDKPLRPRGAGHLALYQFRRGERMTAYEASRRAVGDWHSKRREVERLLQRGFVRKDGTLPNEAPAGREHVDAYVITEAGMDELRRLAPKEETP